jgi:squalene-hopene/tetraprenyl-beta-curcumene cyclase
MKRYTIPTCILSVPFALATVRAMAAPSLQYKAGDIEIPAASSDEPRVTAFNQQTIEAAGNYLDQGAVAWTRSKPCIACHTTGAYMAERPSLTQWLGPPSDEVLEDFVATIPAPNQKAKQNRSVWRALGLAQ